MPPGLSAPFVARFDSLRMAPLCSPRLLQFDAGLGYCNWANQVVCPTQKTTVPTMRVSVAVAAQGVTDPEALESALAAAAGSAIGNRLMS